MPRQRGTSITSTVSSSIPDDNQELGSLYDYLAKVILVGPSGAGKSCLLHRFVNQEWRVLSSQTIGVEFSSKIVKVGTGPQRKRIKLQLWDTAGTERFRSVSRSYYRGAAGAILVYDVASLASFNALPTFLADARALASPNLTVLLAGNKTDLLAGDGLSESGVTMGTATMGGSGASSVATRNSASSLAGSDTFLLSSPWQSQSQSQSHLPMHLRGPPTPSNASASSGRCSGLPYDSGGAGSTGTSLRSTPGTHLTATAVPPGGGREVEPTEAARWAGESNVPVALEVSALNGENVDELFSRLARIILTKIELGEIDPDDPQSGIQYGDGGMYWDGGSVRSGATGTFRDDGSAFGSSKRKKGHARPRVGGAWATNVREWEDVFRGGTRSRRSNCC